MISLKFYLKLAKLEDFFGSLKRLVENKVFNIVIDPISKSKNIFIKL